MNGNTKEKIKDAVAAKAAAAIAENLAVIALLENEPAAIGEHTGDGHFIGDLYKAYENLDSARSILNTINENDV